MKPTHINELMKLALFPAKAVQAKDLEMAIASWERDVHTYETTASEKIPDSHRRFNLMEMCPELLKKHLKMKLDKLLTYDAIKAEIADWVADEVRARPPKPRAAALEQSAPTSDNVDPEWDTAYNAMDANQLLAVFLETPNEDMNQHQLNALVRNLKVKKGKGKGKGLRKCFECESPDHIASACPVRATRVAAGGPERLPRNPDVEMNNAGGKGRGAKGEGKGGKGWKGYPPIALWKTYNPDPAFIKGSQWGHWHPSHMQQPQQLKSLVADGGWMAAPGVMLSGSLRRFSSRTEVETKNSFSALQTEPDLLTDSTVPELPQLEPTKISPRRSPGSTPSRGSPPGRSGLPEPSRTCWPDAGDEAR